MSVKFGTSGLRGLVTDMTPDLITRHVQVFLAVCDTGGILCVGRDLRPSSPRMAQDVIAAAQTAGTRVIDCGELPTPALALAAQTVGGGAVMVTGSHIPADRNGLKFYVRTGEISKVDEAAILAQLPGVPGPGPSSISVDPETDTLATDRYVTRYLDAFGAEALKGQRIGLYAHSAVGRDALARILTGLGAQVIELGRSETFIPVDTEAVDTEVRRQIVDWVQTHTLDALVSTDGDSDRPLMADETGQVVPGDILGQITAETLHAESVVTPISSNSGVALKGFKDIQLTRIGSPYVIAAMEKARGRVMGYEANGGFLLGCEARGPAGTLAPLMTRDCTLPILTVLYAGKTDGIAARVRAEPSIITLADRLQEIDQGLSHTLLGHWQAHPEARAGFLASLGKKERAMDLTDGLRLTLQDGDVVHFRLSGNAPELRVYVETKTLETAQDLLAGALAKLKDALRTPLPPQ